MSTESAFTKDELFDAFERMERPRLDRYVTIRQKYRQIDHDQAITFAEHEHMHISSYQRGLNKGLSFETMLELAEGGYNPRLLFNAMDAGVTLAQAKEAIDLGILAGNDMHYLNLINQGHRHEDFTSTARAITAAGITKCVDTSNVYTLVFRFGVEIGKAIEVVQVNILPAEYNWALTSDISHDEILEVAKEAPGEIHDYICERISISTVHDKIDHTTALQNVRSR